MQIVRVTDVTVPPNRQRREFKEAELQELVGSIQTHGLMHPIVVRHGLEGKLFLVAGERRLRAIQDIYELNGKFTCDGQELASGTIPVITLGELSPLAAREAELEENIRRVDLTWPERAKAVAELASLRQDQAKATDAPKPTMADLAIEVRGSGDPSAQEMTRKEMILAKHLDDPDVKGATSVKEAYKVLKRKEEAKRNVELGELVGKTFNAGVHRLENGDCLDILGTLPLGYFDVILTDPPYGMGADEFGDSGGGVPVGEHFYQDDSKHFHELMVRVLPLITLHTKDSAHLYMFCDIDKFHILREGLKDFGWRVFRTPLIWIKPNAFRAPWPEQGPKRTYEMILYAVKGDRKVNHLAPDTLTYTPDKNLGHNAQKPVALFQDLLARSIRPGDSILDPFMGTGPGLVAAHNLKCRFTGIELDPAAYGIAAGRLKGLV